MLNPQKPIGIVLNVSSNDNLSSSDQLNVDVLGTRPAPALVLYRIKGVSTLRPPLSRFYEARPDPVNLDKPNLHLAGSPHVSLTGAAFQRYSRHKRDRVKHADVSEAMIRG